MVAAAPEFGFVPQRFGLASWMVVQGPLVFEAGIVLEDGVEVRDPVAFRAATSWAAEHSVMTCAGVRPRRLLARTAFSRGVFYRHGYQGRATIVAAELGRVIGLFAQWWRPCRHRFWRDGWSFGFPGAGHVTKRVRRDGTVTEGWNPAPHSPMVRVKAIGSHSSKAAFGACAPYRGAPAGVWVPDARAGRWRPYAGRFMDVIGAAYALDARDTDDLDAHCEAFRQPPIENPTAVTVDPDGIYAVVAACEATWLLALAVDTEAARWLDA